VKVYVIKDEDIERLRLRLRESLASAVEAQSGAPLEVREGYLACNQKMIYLIEIWLQERTK